MPGNRKLAGTEGKTDRDSDAIALAPLVYAKNEDRADSIRTDLLSLVECDGEPVVEHGEAVERMLVDPGYL